MGLVGGQHLKTSTTATTNLPMISSLFFFVFLLNINFGPAGPLKKERERVGWCGLFIVFEYGVRGVSMSLLSYLDDLCFFSFCIERQ